jgi:two-component system, NtrC family, response regulator HydG
MILDNQFRDDLYYRLNVMPIVLPRLKDRINDLENLISVFVKKFNISHHKQVRKINPQALQCLRLYPWPGNIRELENVIEHAFILNDGPEILIQHLPEKILKNANVHLKINADFNESSVSVTGQTTDAVQDIKSSSVANNGPESNGESIDLVEVKSIKIEIDDMDFQKQKDEFEKRFIIEALRANKGKINQTALKSNIPKKTLLRKIEKYGIDAQSLK